MRRSQVVLLLALMLLACGGTGGEGDAGLDTLDDNAPSDTATPDTANPDSGAPDSGPDTTVVCLNPACTVADATKCFDAGSVVTCVDPDGDGCYEWGTPASCETGTVCSNGACATSCSSECTVDGATRCEGDSVLTCVDRSADGCLQWGPAVPCQAGMACSGGVCAEWCSSACTFSGEKKCEGNAAATCGDANGDGCLEWGTPVPCGAGSTCSMGTCQEQCQDECAAVGDTTCFANSVAACADPNGDGCLRWGTAAPCGAGQTCVQGACTGVVVPAGVRLNEVYYDGAGTDTDSFVELRGPSGTKLDGFSVVGVNGGDGQDTIDVALTGTIGADGLFLVLQDTAQQDWQPLADQSSPDIDLQNGPDSVQLRFGTLVIDALAYGTFAATEFPAGEGAPAPDVQGDSLGRFPDGVDTNANAVDWSPQTPSPGAPNLGPDLCYAKACDTPPPAACQGASTLRVWTQSGTCSDGTCVYDVYTDVPCAQGCENGACKGSVPKAAGDVIITEVMPDAMGGSNDTGEWFEVHNPTAMPVDLAGCVLADANPPGVVIAASLTLPAGGYRVLAVSGDPATNFGLVNPYVYAGFSLSNSGEPLSLTCGGVLIDRVSWTANMVHEGVAIQLSKTKLDVLANDDATNWCDATASYGSMGKKGTPGAANGTCAPIANAKAPDAPGQLVITELMAKSQAGGGDKGEWFEIVNASGGALDLAGCWLADKTPGQYQIVEHLVLQAGTYRVLALSNNPTVNFGLVDPYVYSGFNLSNEGEALSITCGGTVIDAISYAVDQVVEGVAVQLSSANLDAVANDLAANWCPATVTFGTAEKKGTPGAPNGLCP